MRKKSLIFLAGLLLIAAGCASGWHEVTNEEVAQPDVSLVYGYMDMSDAPSQMDYFSVKQIKPANGTSFDFDIKKGLFLYQALPRGVYQLDEFGGTSTVGFLIFVLSRTLHRYSFMNPETMNPDLKNPDSVATHSSFQLDTPGIYYLGSYKYLKGKKGEDSFDIEAIKTPNEGAVLQMVYSMPHIRDTKWNSMVLKRMQRLGVQPLNN